MQAISLVAAGVIVISSALAGVPTQAAADEEVSLVANIVSGSAARSDNDGWTLDIALAGTALSHATNVAFVVSPGEVVAVSRAAQADGAAGPHRVALVRADSQAPPSFVLSVDVTTGPHPLDVERSFVYLRLTDDDQIVVEDFERHMAALLRADGSFIARGIRQPIPEADGELPPWESPHLLPADRETARRMAEEDTIGLKEGALSVNSTQENSPAGCGAGHATGGLASLGLGLATIVLCLRRRYGLAALLFIALIPTEARASLVYGYVSFWDTRADKSDATGSRLNTCNTADTTCSPSGGVMCCFRGVSHATLEFWQDSTLKKSVELSATGAFMTTLSNSATQPYSMYLKLNRVGVPGPLVLIAPIQQPGGAAVQFYLGQFYAQGTYQGLGNYPLNLAGDTTSFEGNVATSWTNVTAFFAALVAEGEERHKTPYGSAAESQMQMIYYTNKNWVSCANNGFYFPPEGSRSPYPIQQAGVLYQGHVVGCSPASYSLWNYPKFPEVRGQGQVGSGYSTSEGLAHGVAYRYLAQMLTRWDPSTASFASVVLGTGITCVVDSEANSNEAAYVANNALALWELIDTESAFEDAYDDTIDITMADLMDGLDVNSTATGANMSGDEAVYTPRNPTDQCNDSNGHGNSACANQGDACVLPENNCYFGDPHGGNIFDLAYHLLLLAIANQWPTGYLTTLESSPCMGANDISYPYTGGYRSD